MIIWIWNFFAFCFPLTYLFLIFIFLILYLFLCHFPFTANIDTVYYINVLLLLILLLLLLVLLLLLLSSVYCWDALLRFKIFASISNVSGVGRLVQTFVRSKDTRVKSCGRCCLPFMLREFSFVFDSDGISKLYKFNSMGHLFDNL